jgi:hypothetical protein
MPAGGSVYGWNPNLFNPLASPSFNWGYNALGPASTGRGMAIDWSQVPGIGALANLPNTPTVSPWGYFPTTPRNTYGTTGILADQPDDSGDGYHPNWKTIIPLAGSLAGSLLAPRLDSITGDVNTLRNRAQQQFAQGQQIAGTGADALASVIGYLHPLITGDQAAIAAATAPERKRVIDQYDTAKKAAEFAPRGAQAGAMLNIGAQQAQQLATLPAQARAAAQQAMAQIAEYATQTGLQGESAAQGALANTLYPMLSQRGQDQESIWKTFAALGSLIGAFIPGVGPAIGLASAAASK